MRQFIHSLRTLWNSSQRIARRRARSGCGTESLEARCLLTTAPFQTHFVATPTIVPQFTDGRYQFALADLDGDTKQELFAIRPNGTASGKVEVSVYRGGNNYQELIYRKATALTAVSSDWQFRVFEFSNTVMIAAFNPNDSSGFVSVDLMYSSQNYNTSTHFVTAAPASPDLWDLDMADYNNDLYLDVVGVLKHGASNQTEVHVYSGQEEGGGRYQLPLVHAVTPLYPVGSEFDFIARKFDNDSTPDIVAIKRFGTGTGTTEIHVLSGSSGYSSFVEHIPTGLHETQGNNFQFDMVDYAALSVARDGKHDFIMFSTGGTGSGKVEVHGYSGEPAEVNTILHSFPANTTISDVENLPPGTVGIYEGQQVTFQGTISGPDGTRAIFTNGSFTVAANISVGEVAILAAFNLLAGNQITAPQGVTVKAGQVPILLDGSIDANFFIETGNLSGNPQIDGDFIAGTATPTPSNHVLLEVGHSPGTMTVQALTLNRSVNLKEQIFGSVAGTEYDQIIAGGAVTLNSPTLIPDVTFAAPAGSEFIIIRNDSSQAVIGTFTGESGFALTEGSIISTDFGGTGRIARISYGGGDGNDVVIVVDGDYTFTSPTNAVATDLRVVANNGIAQFYVDGALQQGRTMAGLNTLTVQGEASQVDNVTLDYSGGSLLFPGGIALSTGADTADSLTLFGATVSDVTHTFINEGTSTIAITAGSMTKITYTKLVKINDNLSASTRSVVMSAQAATATVSDSGVASTTRLIAGVGRTIDFVNPSSSLSLVAGATVDQVTVNGLGSGFAAVMNIDTGTGADSVTLQSSLAGLPSLSLKSAAINLNAASVSTVGAQTYTGPVKVGTSTVLTGSSLSFSNTVNATSAGIDLTLNTLNGGTTSLLGSVGNVVAFSGLTTNADGSTILQGNVRAAGSVINFGDALTLQSNSNITNTAGGMTFGGPVSGAFSATINASATATLNGAVSGLTNLQVTAAVIALNTPTITTTGQQNYTGAVLVGIDQILSGSQLKFNSSLDASVADVDLVLTTLNAGTTSLLGNVGSTLPFKSFVTNADGQTVLKANITGAASTIVFNDPLTLQANVILADSGAGSLTFANTLDGGFNIQLESAGAITFASIVGGTTPVGRTTGPAIDIASTGTTLFSRSVRTAAHFNQRDTAGEVTFNEDVTITAAADSIFSGNLVLDGLAFHTGRGITFGSDASDRVTLSTDDVNLDVPATKIATINSQITGPRGVIKSGAGTLALKTPATYGGNTRLSAGFITRGAAELLPDTTHLTIDAGASFSLQNLNETVAGINGAGNSVLGSATLSLANAGDSYDGVISGDGKLVVNAGLQVLTGAHTYTGTTTVNGGNLQLAGGKIGATTAAGRVTIGAGGKLSGTGVVNAAINGLAASTIISSGNFTLGLATSAIGFVTAGAINVGQTGTLTLLDKNTAAIQGNVTLDGGTLSVAQAFSMGTGQTLSGLGTIVASLGVMNLAGATLQPTLVLNMPGFQLSPASTFQIAVGIAQIVATGPVSLNGSQLVVNPSGGYTHVNGKQTVLIDNDGNDPITGEFASFPQGQEFDFGSEKFLRILYKSNFPSTANDVVVKAIEFAVTPTAIVMDGNGVAPSVQFVTNDRGNSIYVWSGPTAGINYVVYGPQGTPLGAVRTLSVSSHAFNYPRIVTTPEGGFAVTGNAWAQTNYVFRLDASGNPVGAPFTFTTSPNTSTFPIQDTFDIAFSSDGSFILAWEEYQNASPFRTRLVSRRFDAAGQALDATPKPVTQFVDQSSRPLRVLRDGIGNTYIAWKNYLTNLDRYDINVRRMLPDGTFIGTQPTILAQDLDGYSTGAPELRINSAGKLVFAYAPRDSSTGTSGLPTGVVVKQLAADLTTVSQQLFSLSDHTTISLAINQSGHYALAYTDLSPSFVRLQKVVWFAPDGKVQYVVSKNEPLNYASTLAMANDGSVVLGGPGFNDQKFRTRAYGEPTDIIAGPLTTNLTSTLSFPYDLRFGASGPLRVRFLKSADKTIDATDQVLANMEFTNAADLTVGTHSKSLAIGSQAGQIPLPGNGLPATSIDYYILAMLDPDDDLFELDIDSPSSDNLTSYFVHFNDAPVIAGVAASITYTENAAALPVAPTGTVTDVDAVQPGYTDFSGGSIALTLASNGNVNDRLEILNQGTAAGQISFTGTKVFYGGTQLGTFAGGSGLAPLVISFTTSAATPPATQALLRAITFRSLGELPSTLPRTLTISLNDGDGGTSSLTSQTINVISVPDVPVIGAFHTSIAYTENNASLVLDADATVTDIDSADFSGGTLTATLITIRETADVLSIKPIGSGASIVAVSNGQVSVGGVTVGSFVGGTSNNPIVITLNASATPARMQFLVRAIAFNSTSDNPGTAPRTVQLVLTDGDGGTSAAVSKSITVTAVNDAPVVGPAGPQANYSAGDAPIPVVTTAAISDIDSTNFDAGKLTVSIITNAQGSDRLAIKSVGTGPGQISTTTDFRVFLGTVQIGTFNGGIGSTPLVVSFNANATPAIAQQLLAAVQYSNTLATPSLLQRTVRVTLTDGDGGTSTAVKQKINVNDDPVIGSFGGPVTYTRGGAAKLITTTATVTDSSANFGAGLLTLAITGSDGSDVLSIKSSATLTIANLNEIFLNGIKIGSFTGGTNNTSLVIALTANANAARVQTLLRAIQFTSSTTAASPGPRTLHVTLSDGLGGLSAALAKSISIVWL